MPNGDDMGSVDGDQDLGGGDDDGAQAMPVAMMNIARKVKRKVRRGHRGKARKMKRARR